jgi:hypothetical protein
MVITVADADPESGAFLTPGSGIQNKLLRILGTGSQTLYFSGGLMTTFLVKSSIILCKLSQIFLFTSSKKIIYNFQFCDICGYNKKVEKIFFTPLFIVVAVFGPGMDKNQNPGSGMRNTDVNAILCLLG